MGWWLTWAAEAPAPEPADHSLTTALIYALGTVLVALITIGLPLLFRQAKNAEPAPVDPRLGETVAVLASREVDDRKTLAQLDRHVDGIGDQVDRLRWEVDNLKNWQSEHRREHER